MSLKKIREIAEGWRNVVMPPEKLKELITLTVEHRMKKCLVCPWHSWNSKNVNALRPDAYCTKCGCTLSAKMASLRSACPLDPPKWGPVNINIEDDESNS
jgi:hypothetical protein